MQKHGPVPKAEDKSPAKKKRQRVQHKEDAKKAKIEDKETQSAWSKAIKSKTDKTDKEDKEDDTEKADNVEQGKGSHNYPIFHSVIGLLVPHVFMHVNSHPNCGHRN